MSASPFPPVATSSRSRTLAIALCRAVALVLLGALAPGTPALAGGSSSLSDSDRMAIREVIRAQLDAFQRDDAERAFSYASPSIQRRSGTPAEFLAMVRKDYAVVYRPRAVFFQDVTVIDGMPAQRVLLMDANGAHVLAIYPMEHQADGTWRIDGCMLYRGDARML